MSASTILRKAGAAFLGLGDDFGYFLLAAAGDDAPPEVRANVIPRQVDQGKLLQVQALFVDRKTGEPVKQDQIFIRIRDGSGIEVYPTSLKAVDQSGFVINIGTGDFKPGRYTLQVSNNRSYSPSDTVPFAVIGPAIPLDQPVLFEPDKDPVDTPLPPDKNLRKKVDEDLVPVVPLIPSDRATFALQSGLVRFVTELDLKVCHICAPFDGETYAVDDVDKPRIPLHPNCRCHYEHVSPLRDSGA